MLVNGPEWRDCANSGHSSTTWRAGQSTNPDLPALPLDGEKLSYQSCLTVSRTVCE